MIPVRDVTNAVLALLQGVDGTLLVGDGQAPGGAKDAQRYAVLLFPPSPPTDGPDAGSMAAPEANAWVRVRIRGVGRGKDQRQSAQWVVDKLKPTLMDRTVPIEGDGWAIASRQWEGSAGVETDGAVSNVDDDFLLLAVAT